MTSVWDDDDGYALRSYAIVCRRDSGSVFGAATAFAKDGSRTLLFDTEAAALAQAKQWNDTRTSPHVSYTVEAYGWKTK